MTTKNTRKSASVPLVRIVSLGCAKNFVDTEQAAASLAMHGFGLTPDPKEADLVFINTCAFLKASRCEAEEEIITAENWKKRSPRRKIVVAGCIVEWDKNGDFRKSHPAVDAWLPVTKASRLGELAEQILSGHPCVLPEAEQNPPRLTLTPGHYAWLRVSDGCDNRCAYCLIPSIRGPLHSRPEADILQEAESLLQAGTRELLVIAQDTAGYGRDLTGKPLLADLLRKLDALQGDFWLRLLYLHPASVTDELINAMAESRHLIKCIEMPIQHVSENMLKRMNRHISEEELRETVAKLKARGFAIRTTLMTGFPGETEEDFRKLVDFTKESRFLRLGVFAYSKEEGTPAAKMEQLPEGIGEKRRDELMKIQREISRSINASLVGKTLEIVLDETAPDGTGRGRTKYDVPEIDNSVAVRALNKKAFPGDRMLLEVESATEYEISGRPLKSKKNEDRKK